VLRHVKIYERALEAHLRQKPGHKPVRRIEPTRKHHQRLCLVVDEVIKPLLIVAVLGEQIDPPIRV
jgi:hypothetical protein